MINRPGVTHSPSGAAPHTDSPGVSISPLHAHWHALLPAADEPPCRGQLFLQVEVMRENEYIYIHTVVTCKDKVDTKNKTEQCPQRSGVEMGAVSKALAPRVGDVTFFGFGQTLSHIFQSTSTSRLPSLLLLSPILSINTLSFFLFAPLVAPSLNFSNHLNNDSTFTPRPVFRSRSGPCWACRHFSNSW
jgi:hypothetical protein